jgi:hypothetical protein
MALPSESGEVPLSIPAFAIVTGEGPQWVNGDCWQSEDRFCFQAISGTYSASKFTGYLFSVRPKGDIRSEERAASD